MEAAGADALADAFRDVRQRVDGVLIEKALDAGSLQRARTTDSTRASWLRR